MLADATPGLADTRQNRPVPPGDPTGSAGLARRAGTVPLGADRGSPQAAAAFWPRDGAEAEGKGAEQAAAEALAAAGARRAVFSRADVAGHVAAHLPTSGVSATEVVERVEQLTDLTLGQQDAVAVTSVSKGVTPRASDGRYATVQVLAAEARILDLAARGRRCRYGQVAYTGVIGAGHDARLDPSQARAVLHLAGGWDFLSVLTAPRQGRAAPARWAPPPRPGGLIAAGCDVVTVQRALGHAKATTTLNTYAHLWPTAEDRTRKAASGLFAAATTDAATARRRPGGSPQACDLR